jgi:two-component system, sensor histidine kinase
VILNQSVFGEGSTFECTFRNLTSVDGKIPGEIMIDQCLIQLPTTAKILIADDSSDNIELIKFYIQSAGVTDIEVATNGLEAVEKSKNPNIELILMDIQMPDMDGYEATRKIRERGQKIPIIALTAHASAEHRQHAINAGCTDILTKPLQHHVLVNILGNYLKKLNPAASM